jgi:hypothetical protein
VYCIALTFPGDVGLLTGGITKGAVAARLAFLVVQIEVIERGTFDPVLIK